MSPAACAGSPPGPRCESLGTAGLLCTPFGGRGLAVAEPVGQGTSTAWVSVQLGRRPGDGGGPPRGNLQRSSAEPRRLRRGALAVLRRHGTARPARRQLTANGRNIQMTVRRGAPVTEALWARTWCGREGNSGERQLQDRR